MKSRLPLLTEAESSALIVEGKVGIAGQGAQRRKTRGTGLLWDLKMTWMGDFWHRTATVAYLESGMSRSCALPCRLHWASPGPFTKELIARQGPQRLLLAQFKKQKDRWLPRAPGRCSLFVDIVVVFVGYFDLFGRFGPV